MSFRPTAGALVACQSLRMLCRSASTPCNGRLRGGDVADPDGDGVLGRRRPRAAPSGGESYLSTGFP